MADKITLATVSELQAFPSAAAAINSNSAIITAAIDNTLSLDGSQPNSMEANLDMNSNRILNLPTPVSNLEPARLVDLETLTGSGTITINPLPTGGTTGQSLTKNSNSNFDAGWSSVGVAGPSSANDGHVVSFSGTTGKIIQDSGLIATGLINSINQQIYTSSSTYGPSAGMVFVIIECVGGGGGGGGSAGQLNLTQCGGSGGSGGYSKHYATRAQIGTSRSVIVGTNGVGVSGFNSGTNGSASQVIGLCGANGGLGGTGGGAASASFGGNGGTAGSGNIVAAPGVPGSGCGYINFNDGDISGTNGASLSGWGAGGLGVANNSANGNSATGFGSGGSGAMTRNTTGSTTGGNGSPGIVIITEYCNQ